jgi:threonine/homoserine/homoserine lactone efflux protein
MVHWTYGASIFAIPGSLSDSWIDADVEAEKIFERIMAVLAVGFVVLLIWRFVAEWKN